MTSPRTAPTILSAALLIGLTACGDSEPEQIVSAAELEELFAQEHPDIDSAEDIDCPEGLTDAEPEQNDEGPSASVGDFTECQSQTAGDAAAVVTDPEIPLVELLTEDQTVVVDFSQ